MLRNDEPNLLEKGLRSLRRSLPDVNINLVWIEKSHLFNGFTDTYFDNVDPKKANALEDGVFTDRITCRNGAVPNAAEVRTALRQLQRDGSATYEGSTALSFEGDTNPIAAACKIALRPAKTR